MENKNIDHLQEFVIEGINSLRDLKEKRTGINQEMGSIRANFESKGLSKKALNFAMQYINMDPDDRKGFDEAYAFIRETWNLPVNAQGDLLAVIEEQAAEQN